MKGKWLKLFLVASLAINVAFITSTLLHRAPSPTPFTSEPQTSDVTPKATSQETLDSITIPLRDDQKKEIQSIIKKFKIDMLQYKQDILDKRIAIIEALGDAGFNPGDVDGRTTELNQLENQLNLIFVEALVKVSNVLDGQQRLKFLLHLSRNWFFMNGQSETTAFAGGRHE